MLIDSHCHLDFSDFDSDRQDIIKQCISSSIDTIIIPGTQVSSWQNLLELVTQHPQLKAALGLHPYFLTNYNSQDFIRLRRCVVEHQKHIVAIGEIGLDFACDIDRVLQLSVFSQQLEIADEFALPIILHHRRSHNEIIKQLKHQKFRQGGIVHAFSGSLYEANTYIEMGFKLGIGGIITYPRAQKTRMVVSQVPLTSLVLETDAPDMPPMGKQGQRNTPLNLLMVLNELVSLREEDKDLIISQCRQNVFMALKNLV